MTDLIACISDERGMFNHIKQVIEGESWNNIFLIASKRFTIDVSKKFELIIIDESLTISELVSFIKQKLDNRIGGIEVAANLVCGSGKMHMALMSALLKSGLAVRLIALTKEGVREV